MVAIKVLPDRKPFPVVETEFNEGLSQFSPDGRLMAVPLRFAAAGTPVEPGTPVALFRTILSGAAGPMYNQQYMVVPGGQSFVMQSAVGEANATPITIIQNWKPRAGN
jgi:hypothetical protein